MSRDLNDISGREATAGATGSSSDVYDQLARAVNVQMRLDPNTKKMKVTNGLSGKPKRLQAVILSTVADGMDAEPQARTVSKQQQSKEKREIRGQVSKDAVNKMTDDDGDTPYFVSYATASTRDGKPVVSKTLNTLSYVQTRNSDTMKQNYLSDMQSKIGHVTRQPWFKIRAVGSKFVSMVNNLKGKTADCSFDILEGEYNRVAKTIISDGDFTPGFNKRKCQGWLSEPTEDSVAANGLCFTKHKESDGKYEDFPEQWADAYDGVNSDRIRALAQLQFMDDVLHYDIGSVTVSNKTRAENMAKKMKKQLEKPRKFMNGKYKKPKSHSTAECP